MLAKLYKYDMKSIVRQMGLIWILCPIIATVFAFSIRGEAPVYNDGYDIMPTYYITKFFPMICGFTFFGVAVAILAMTIIFIIQRFWKGLLGDEGYLMFTLPVSTTSLILSKMLSALTVVILGACSGVLSIMLFIMVLNDGKGIFAIFNVAIDYIGLVVGADFVARYILTGIFVFLAVLIHSIYHVYLAMAIGQLVSKYRIIVVCVSFMVINFLVSTIFNVVVNLAALITTSHPLGVLLLMISYGMGELIFAAIFHIAIEYIFRHRLNLE